ncbi:MAG: shikimate kinase, partial [Chthoniobacterales bacterium]
ETERLAGISDLSAKIVVTGGGIVLRAENVARLRSLGRVVYLTADEEILFARATESGARPLLQTNDPRATFAGLLDARMPLYRTAADLVIDTTHLSPEEVADAVLAHE